LQNFFTDIAAWLSSQGQLLFPLLLTLWIAGGDIRTHRIPNYLTLGTALTGLVYQGAFFGFSGLGDGLLGLALGFGLLIGPYMLGGMGAGDVKALSALGAWLGPWKTFLLFCYMGIAGGLLAILILWWRGQLLAKLRQGWVVLLNWILLRPAGAGLSLAPAPPSAPSQGLPYGVAIFLGMFVLYARGG